MIANRYTEENIERHEIELRYVKTASAQLESIKDSTDNKTLKKKIERLYDLLHSSPVKSNSSVKRYELTVMNLIDVLEDNIRRDDLSAAEETINQIERNASERNRRLKYQ